MEVECLLMSFSSSGLPSSADGTNSRRSSGCTLGRIYILEGPVQLTNVSCHYFFFPFSYPNHKFPFILSMTCLHPCWSSATFSHFLLPTAAFSKSIFTLSIQLILVFWYPGPLCQSLLFCWLCPVHHSLLSTICILIPTSSALSIHYFSFHHNEIKQLI